LSLANAVLPVAYLPTGYNFENSSLEDWTDRSKTVTLTV